MPKIENAAMLIMERQSRNNAPTERQSFTNTIARKNTAEMSMRTHVIQ